MGIEENVKERKRNKLKYSREKKCKCKYEGIWWKIFIMFMIESTVYDEYSSFICLCINKKKCLKHQSFFSWHSHFNACWNYLSHLENIEKFEHGTRNMIDGILVTLCFFYFVWEEHNLCTRNFLYI